MCVFVKRWVSVCVCVCVEGLEEFSKLSIHKTRQMNTMNRESSFRIKIFLPISISMASPNIHFTWNKLNHMQRAKIPSIFESFPVKIVVFYSAINLIIQKDKKK